MAHFIDVLDNQMYVAALHCDFLSSKLDLFPELRGLTKMVRLALKTFSLAVYLNYPGKKCCYIIKNPVVVLACTGAVVYGTDFLKIKGFDNGMFFNGVFDNLRMFSGVVFVYEFLKIPLQDFYRELLKN